METQTNKNASLSNAFVQHPQSLFTCIETKIYHAALLCLHRNTADLSATYCINLKDIFSKSGSNYAAMHLAISSLLERRWFDQPLFLKLEYFKREGCIELTFNTALQEHLLHADENYTCLPVAQLTEAGLTNPLAWRLLWLLRSYYRGYSTAKKLTIQQLEELLWNNERESVGYARLKQAIDAAVKSLHAAGLIDTTAKTNKRGLVAKGIDFTIPAFVLSKAVKKTAISRAVKAVKETVAEAVELVKEAVTVAPIAAAMAIATPVVEAAPANKPAAGAGNISGLLKNVLTVNQKIDSSRLRNDLKHKPEPDYTQEPLLTQKIVAAPVLTHEQALEIFLKVLATKYMLYNSQINIINNYLTIAVTQEQLAERFKNIRSLLASLDLTKKDKIGAFVWSELVKKYPYLLKIKDVLDKKK